jgi:hypothetical protein
MGKKGEKEQRKKQEVDFDAIIDDFTKALEEEAKKAEEELEPLNVLSDDMPRYYAKFNGIKFPLNTLAELEGLLYSVKFLKEGKIKHFFGSASAKADNMTEVIIIDEILTPVTVEIASES